MLGNDHGHPGVAASAAHISAGSPVLMFSLVVSLVIGATLIGGGVALVYLGGHGETELVLFGNTFKSQNVGAVGIFCGAVMVVLAIRRVVTAVERLGRM